MTRKPVATEPIEPKIDGRLSQNEVMDIIRKKCNAEVIFNKGKGSRLTVFVPHGWANFCASTNYGKITPENEIESQYFLEGYYFMDKYGKSTTVITNVITPFSASQGRSSAELYSEGKTNAYDYVEKKEKELAKYASPGRDVETGALLNPFVREYGPPHKVGLGHTHPGLSCFFSSVDKTSVFAVPGEPWITMVADPRKCDVISGIGVSLEPSKIVVFEQEKESSNVKTEVVTTHIRDITLDQLLRVFRDAYKAEIPVSFSISGKFPGRVKFKGAFSIPKKKRK